MAEDNKNDIPEMNLREQLFSNKPILPNQDELQKNMEKTKKELNKLKLFATKKYPFIEAIGLLPPQSIKDFY